MTQNLELYNVLNSKNNLMNLIVGNKFPDFKLSDDNGKIFQLYKDSNSSFLVLYFYPKDETPGCTKQACYFKYYYADFKQLDCEIIGISSDDEKSHKKFKSKYNLPFKLLCDRHSRLRKEIKLPKDFFGLSPGRVTFLLSSVNEILFIHKSSLKMKSHIKEVLEFLNKNILV